jgi:16S rRNA (guanine527-N7)-methyltransferase
LKNQFKKGILDKLQKIGLWDVSGRKAERISCFIEDVWEWSNRIHLLGRKEIWKNIERQIIDSAYMLQLLEGNIKERGYSNGQKGVPGGEDSIFKGKRLSDIGSGAGFPGLVWKILRPSLEMTLFERKQKAAAFLTREVNILDLKKVVVSDIDVERYTGDLFDIVTSKAAGRLPEMLPLASGLLSEGGVYITVKGDGWREKERVDAFLGMEFKRENEIPGKRGVVVIFGKVSPGRKF